MTCNKCPKPAIYHVVAVAGHEDNWLGRIARLIAERDGVDTDTREIDGYYCHEHAPSRADVLPGELRRYGFAVLDYKRERLPH